MPAPSSFCVHRQVGEAIRLYEMKNGPWHARHPTWAVVASALGALISISLFVGALCFWAAALGRGEASPAELSVMMAALILVLGSALIYGVSSLDREEGAPVSDEFLGVLAGDPRIPAPYKACVEQAREATGEYGLSYGALLELAEKFQAEEQMTGAAEKNGFNSLIQFAGESR